MSDLTNNADALGGAVHCALIELGGAATAVAEAHDAFERGDIDHARLVIANATVALNDAGLRDPAELIVQNAPPYNDDSPVSGY